MLTRRFTTILLLGSLLLGLGSAAHAFLNPLDRIWDFSGSQLNVVMNGTYKESPDNGLIDQTLELGIENAPAFTDFSIIIRGRALWTMTTDATGNADFRVDRLGRVPGPDGRPLGKKLETGEVIRVANPSVGIDVSGALVPRP